MTLTTNDNRKKEAINFSDTFNFDLRSSDSDVWTFDFNDGTEFHYLKS